jgi:hypothetical protein
MGERFRPYSTGARVELGRCDGDAGGCTCDAGGENLIAGPSIGVCAEERATGRDTALALLLLLDGGKRARLALLSRGERNDAGSPSSSSESAEESPEHEADPVRPGRGDGLRPP